MTGGTLSAFAGHVSADSVSVGLHGPRGGWSHVVELTEETARASGLRLIGQADILRARRLGEPALACVCVHPYHGGTDQPARCTGIGAVANEGYCTGCFGGVGKSTVGPSHIPTGVVAWPDAWLV